MRLVATLLVLAGCLAGCGFEVQEPDLFALTRVGLGKPLRMTVNYGGTITCNGGPSKQLPDPLLLQARDLANSLDKDAKARLRIPPSAHSVATYTVRLQDGTIVFPDTAGAQHAELAQAEQFILQAAQQGCGLTGQ